MSDSRTFGLKNQGATCYLNSVLQVLFKTKGFREAVERSSCDGASIDPELKSLFKTLKKRTAETVGITRKLGINDVYQQRDAAECIEKILTLCSHEASQIFRGELTDNTVCACGDKTVDKTLFWNLPLGLVKSHIQSYSVVDGIKDFLKTSYFIGDSQLYCERCCRKCEASSTYTITHHPEVLMLLLKRFEFKHNSYVKNDCPVDIPCTLTVPQNQVYDIYAFVEHSGSLSSGHYTATIKCPDREEERWFMFNDRQVQLKSRGFVGQDKRKNPLTRSRSAYLLFYRKKCTAKKKHLTLPSIFNNNGCNFVTKKQGIMFVAKTASLF